MNTKTTSKNEENSILNFILLNCLIHVFSLEVIEISGTIFLDLDGTLLDTSQRHYMLYSDLLDKMFPNILKHSLPQFWNLKRSGTKTRDILHPSLPNGILTCFEEEWMHKIEKKSYLQYDKLFPGIKSVLQRLNREFDLVLVTLRSNRDNLQWELSKLYLKSYFKSILSGKGPKKSLIEDYLTQNYSGESCLVVGDTEEDIKAGSELEMVTVSVTCGIRSKEFLEEFHPDFCINSLQEIVSILK